jgi:hypothetical protein
MLDNPYLKHQRELKQKHYEKQEHSRSKSHQESWKQEELPLDWSAPLAEIEVDELFWDKLVQLGWKIQEYGNHLTLSKNIVLACPVCNNILDSYPKTSITKRDGNKMADSRYCERIIASHNGFVCEAIPEA